MLTWILEQAGNWSDVLTIIGVLGTAGLGVVKMLMAGRKRFEAMFAETKLMKKQGEALQDSVNAIVAQLTPNGGSSMFDMVKSAHKMSADNATIIGHVKDTLDSMRAMQWQFAETLSDKPIWECDPNGACVRVNVPYAKLAERTPGELAGSGWENFIDPPDRARVYEEWADAIDRKRIFESVFAVRSRSGSRFTVKAVATPVVADNGKIVGYLGRFDDVKPLT